MRQGAASLSRPIGRVLSAALVKCCETFAGAGLVWGTSNWTAILEAMKRSPDEGARPKTRDEPAAASGPAARRRGPIAPRRPRNRPAGSPN